MKMLETAPSVNDLAYLLSDAMRRPLFDAWHRPRTIRLRDNPEWQELVPHLHELRIDVDFSDNLPAWDEGMFVENRLVLSRQTGTRALWVIEADSLDFLWSCHNEPEGLIIR